MRLEIDESKEVTGPKSIEQRRFPASLTTAALLAIPGLVFLV